MSATGGGPSASSTSPSASAGGGGYGSAVICTAGPADVRAALTCLVGKIQKFCHTQTQSPPSVRVALIGSDTFVNSVLRPYVEVFSSKPPDWQGYLKFFIIPLGTQNSLWCFPSSEFVISSYHLCFRSEYRVQASW